MKHAKTLATSVAVVVATSATALAMNVGILQATSGSDGGDDGAGEWAAEPTVLAIETDALPGNTSSPSANAAPAAAAERSAPAATAAPAPAAPAAAPTPTAPTTAPESSTTSAAQTAPTTTYHTYKVGSVGEVVIANHGSSLEFWAAYAAPGIEYGVEDATGNEIEVGFRGDGVEIEWKAKLEGGQIKIEMEDD
jgi:hypothetical protein